MVKLEIIEKDNYKYVLENERGLTYTLLLEFFDISESPDVGDEIYFNEQLLNPKYDGYSTSYIFGNLESKYGKANIELDDVDVIKLALEDREIYLKRLYG